LSCEEMVKALRDAGVEAQDLSISPGSLGLPDSARVRLLVDHEGLFHIYCAENLPSTLPIARVKGALKAARDEALLLLDRGAERFVVLHTTAEGEAAQVELARAKVLRLLPNVKAGEGEDPYDVSERVRDLILHPVEERKPYLNRGLFSDDYLDYRLTDPLQYTEWKEDVSRAYGKLRDLYESKKELLDGLNEAQTESEFLDEALEVLGYSFIKQTRARDGSRPDYALFGDARTKDEALRVQDDPTRLYAASLAVAEGKYWGRNLDVYTKKDDRDNKATASQKSAPGMQISRYLQETDLPWGILTNGSEWRLYYSSRGSNRASRRSARASATSSPSSVPSSKPLKKAAYWMPPPTAAPWRSRTTRRSPPPLLRSCPASPLMATTKIRLPPSSKRTSEPSNGSTGRSRT
jgi:hypothetical protein